MGQYDELKEQILEYMKKKKKKLTMKDIRKGFPDQKPRDMKKATSEMIQDRTIEYWSSGSTTYFSLPESIMEERKEED